MIQRIQTVYLFIAAIAMLVLLFMPFGNVYTEKFGLTFDAFALRDISPDPQTAISTIYIAILLIVSAALSIIAIFMYKNRLRQINMVSVNMLLFLFTIALILFIYPDVVFVRSGLMSKADIYEYNLWILLPLCITALCLFLANKAIKKDEKLVRAADRLR
ncbi:MAG: DUF4293 domain-containing protein [Bacteroidales bacterium]|jgi:hypothetical protein|nr:DUF4293 domain-containing protein [Bacteroidales bacterium]